MRGIAAISTKQPETRWIQLVAGADNKGMPVLEKLEVYVLEQQNHFELIRSPLFVRNLAAGDVFSCREQTPELFDVVKRSGNLAIRVFRRDGIDAVAEALTPEVEKLDGRLDLQTDRALVYTLHVNIGFGAIEALFDGVMARFPDSVWYYGNIYDPVDGTTPLNWWDAFLNQV